MSDEIWRTMDRATLSKVYDNFGAVPDAPAQLARWARLSAELRAASPATLDLAYGPRPRNRIDLLAGGAADAPLLAFIHGGYWQRNAKDDFTCMAAGPIARGLDVALVGYTLAPEASLTDIAGEIDAALAFLRQRHRGRLVVSGWSAGGHLAALTMSKADAALTISGIYDLAPIRQTILDDKLGLTSEEVQSRSPLRNLPDASGPLTIAFGARELPELRRQSTDYHAALGDAGRAATLLAIPEADHFSILDGLIDPAGALTEAAARLAGGG